MTEILISDFDKVRLGLIRDAYMRGIRYGTIDPNSQPAPWFVHGLRKMEQNGGLEVTPEELDRIDKSGGTDHPDPTLRSRPGTLGDDISGWYNHS